MSHIFKQHKTARMEDGLPENLIDQSLELGRALLHHNRSLNILQSVMLSSITFPDISMIFVLSKSFMALRLLRSQDLGISGSQDLRITGSQDFRILGSQDLRVSESQDLRLSGFQTLKLLGSHAFRFSGLYSVSH